MVHENRYQDGDQHMPVVSVWRGRVALAVLLLLAAGLQVVGASGASASTTVLCESTAYACAGGGYSGTDPWGYSASSCIRSDNGTKHNCTSYAAFRLAQNGAVKKGNLGPAGSWAANAAAQYGGGAVNGTPAVGAIAQWNAGHVSYVEEVGAGYIVVTEDNCAPYNVTRRKKITTGTGWPDNFLHIADIPVGNPFGSVDSAGSSGPGYVNVAGWALDPNAPASAIGVHVYVGGPAGAAGAEGHAVTANTYRPDVPKVYPGVGDYHGYDYKFATDKVGTQPVYVYALNAGGTPGSNQLIASRTVTIKDPSPFGSFDQVTSPAPARVNVAGWDVDPNVPTSAIAVHVYVGGPSGAAGAEGHAVMANGYRPDVPKVYPGVGDYHGLNVTFDTTKSGAVPVYFYGINRDGTPGHNVLLGSKTVTIAPVALTVSVKPTYSSTRLKVNVGPDWASGNYSFQLQKLVDGAWSTVGTYLTSGTLDTKTVNPTKGVYRVVLPQQRNATTGVTSTSVRITS